MPLLLPPGYANAAIHVAGPVGTPEFVTTIGFAMPLDFAPSVEMANNVFRSFTEAFGAAFATGWNVNRVSAHYEEDDAGASVDSTLAPFSAGGGGNRQPVQMSIVLQKRCAAGGRARRGRMFLPGCIQTDMVDESGKLKPAHIADFQSKCNTFLAQLTTPSGADVADRASTPPVLLHSTSMEPTPITSLKPAAQVGWIRSRG